MTKTTVIRARDLVAVPWKNGGGVTREVAADPPGAAWDAFSWRVSIAEVAQAGPFSCFDGVDRALVLLAGAGIRLYEAQRLAYELSAPLEIARFEGEAQIDAELIDGVTSDLNVMTRRSVVHAELTVWVGDRFEARGADTLVLFCVEGPVEVALGSAESYVLQARDTLRIDAPGDMSCKLSGGRGVVLATRLCTV